jgi:hypothetical protein
MPFIRVSKVRAALNEAAQAGNVASVLEQMIEQFVELGEELKRGRSPRLSGRVQSEDHGEADAILAAWPLDDDEVLERANAWIRRVLARTAQPVGRAGDFRNLARDIVRYTTQLRNERGSSLTEPDEDEGETRRQTWRLLLEEASVDDLEDFVHEAEERLKTLLGEASRTPKTVE